MKKEFDVLIAGELNVDLIFNQLESFPEPGKEKLAKQMTFTLGSSSAICASNLSSLGLRVAFKGKVGTDEFGSKVLFELRENGVSTDLIIRDASKRTGITVAMQIEDEDRAMLTYAGAMKDFSADEITDKDLKKARHLHVSSIFLQPKLKSDVAGLFKRARQHGLTTSLDPQWDPDEKWDLDLETLLPYLNLFLPNQQEFLHLAQSETIRKGAGKFAGTDCIIVIKQAESGATLFNKGEEMHKDAFNNAKPVDAIGAGDSFDAGFIFKFVQNAPLEECMEFGNMVGAVSTTAAGGTAGIVSLEQVFEVAKRQLGYRET